MSRFEMVDRILFGNVTRRTKLIFIKITLSVIYLTLYEQRL